MLCDLLSFTPSVYVSEVEVESVLVVPVVFVGIALLMKPATKAPPGITILAAPAKAPAAFTQPSKTADAAGNISAAIPRPVAANAVLPSAVKLFLETDSLILVE